MVGLYKLNDGVFFPTVVERGCTGGGGIGCEGGVVGLGGGWSVLYVRIS